jgi:RNA polymerase sigma-70 factor (ECF subfamily)
MGDPFGTGTGFFRVLMGRVHSRTPTVSQFERPQIFLSNFREYRSSYIEGSEMAEAVISRDAIQLVKTTQDAVQVIVREHARLVYRIAFSVLRNHHDAEDATQETFVRVLRYGRKLGGIRDEKAWLARIAWRVAVERRKASPEISLDAPDEHLAISQLESQWASAEEFSLERETARLLQSLIFNLPTRLRDVLVLSTVKELTPEEIGKVLGISDSSVRSRLFRARQILKEKLTALEEKYGSAR